MADLGNLRREQGRTDDDDPDGASHWLRLAAVEGYIPAMADLGNLRREQGRTD